MTTPPIEPGTARCGKPVDISGWIFDPPEPVCAFAPGHETEHPCAARQEKVGERCRYCGETLTVVPCSDCWTSMPDNLADQKALLALGDFSVQRP